MIDDDNGSGPNEPDLFDDPAWECYVETSAPEDGYGIPPGHGQNRGTPPSDDIDVASVMRSCLASCHGGSFDELADMVRTMKAAPDVLHRLGTHQDRWNAVLECLLDTAANAQGGMVDFRRLPTAAVYDRDVRHELDRLSECAGVSHDVHPGVAWFALREQVQRDQARRTAASYVSALRRQAPAEELMGLYRHVEPPTTRKASIRRQAARTAREVLEDRRVQLASSQPMRISCGLPTLDVALTGIGEARGFGSPGEGIVVAGPTGTGKTSFCNIVVPSMVQDVINWGRPHGRVLFVHTEEESHDKLKAMNMEPGAPLHHLVDNLVVLNAGTSRKLIAMTLYDMVADAHGLSLKTGLPITDFLPYVLVLDYLQSIREQGESEVEATALTSEFLLRGVQMWNCEEMEKFSGVSYREYTGSPWPDGMDNHRVLGVYMAQLVKQDDSIMFFRPDNRKFQYSDFTIEDDSDTPVWVDANGSGWSWEVREGDFRLVQQNAIRGSGVILQNATSILVLHRSRVKSNPKHPHPGPDGRFHLTDTRARILLDKTRTGSGMKFAPLAFDLGADGFRAQYYDPAAEEAIRRGILQPHDVYTRAGDPILPIRPTVDPLGSVRY